MPSIGIFMGVSGSAAAAAPFVPRVPGTDSPLVASISPASGEVGTTFTASLSGDRGSPSGTLTYQWKDEGVNIDGATGSTFVATSAEIGTGTLTVEITVTNASGSASDTSDGVTVTDVPEELTAPQSLAATTADDRTLAVTWSAPAEGVPTGYDIRWSTDESTWTTIDDVSSPYDLTDLPIGGATYYVQVRAKDGSGDGPWSASDTAATHVRPYGIEAEWNKPIADVLSRGANPYETYFANRLLTHWLFPNWLNLFDRDYTYPVYYVSDATETANLVKDFGNAGSTIPWNPSWTIPSGTDAQVILLDESDGREWNIFEASYAPGSPGTLTVTRANIITVNADGTGGNADYRTKTNGFRGSRGPGIQYLVGLIRPEEIAQGKIYHALSMPTKNPGYTLFATPATKGERFPGNEDEKGIPQGSRWYLDASEAEIDAHIATFPVGVSQETKDTLKIVFTAMAEYGVLVSDNAGSNHIQFQHDDSTDWTPYGMDEYATGGKTWPRDAMDDFSGITGKIKWVSPPDDVYFNAEPGFDVAPVELQTPVISGPAAVGETLTLETPVVHIGEAPVTTARQWQRDGVDISGATGTTYVVQEADVGTTITCRVTGTNAAGSDTADSNGIAISSGAYTPVFVNGGGTAFLWNHTETALVPSDGTSFTLAVLLRDTDDLPAANRDFFNIFGRTVIGFRSDGDLEVACDNTSNVLALQWRSDADARAAGESLYVINVSVSGSGGITVTRNGSAIAGTVGTNTSPQTLDFTRSYSIMAQSTAQTGTPPTTTNIYPGDVAYLAFWAGETITYAQLTDGSDYLDPAAVGTPEIVLKGAGFGTGDNEGSGADLSVTGTFS